MPSSATEYWLELLEEGGDDLWAEVASLAGAEIVAFGTELPTWLKNAAFEAIEDAFEQPYWQQIVETSMGDILTTIKNGIEDGLSIRELAVKIQDDRGGDYPMYRATNTARTEMTNMMSAGHVAGMDAISEETGVEMRPEWLSVYGITSRNSHMALDGQQADAEGLFTMVSPGDEPDPGEYRIPWPGFPSLPASLRCNCQCSVLSSFVGEEVDRTDLDAVREELLNGD